MECFFDTETTGLPKNYNAPASDLKNWPRLVQLAYAVVDKDENMIGETNVIIKPDGFKIPKEASEVHGITQERAMDEGIALSKALDEFYNCIKHCETLVAHNMSYDYPVMGAEFIRNKTKYPQLGITKICTKESSTDLCAIPAPWNEKYFKWPTLQELHQTLFKEGFDGAHDALVDVRAGLRCYLELKKIGVTFKTLK
jgi:DNA polymerase III epsilon subunit-like protein